MIKIGHVQELNMVEHLPKELKESLKEILTVLDNEYGEKRNIDNEGGYILLVESKNEFQALKKLIIIDIEADAIPEYVDNIRCDDGQVFTNSLFICNSDYSISIVMSINITPKNLKNYINQK